MHVRTWQRALVGRYRAGAVLLAAAMLVAAMPATASANMTLSLASGVMEITGDDDVDLLNVQALDSGFAVAWRKLAVALGNSRASEERIVAATTRHGAATVKAAVRSAPALALQGEIAPDDVVAAAGEFGNAGRGDGDAEFVVRDLGRDADEHDRSLRLRW